MARQRKNFIQGFSEAIAEAGKQHGLGDPDWDNEVIPGPPVVDEDGEPVEDEDGEPMNYPPITAIGATFKVKLYTPVKGHPGVYKEASIPRRMRRKCLAKTIIGSGGAGKKPARAFYEKRELDAMFPGGWTRWEEAYEAFEIECFDETCAKRFDSAQKLRQHMLSGHGADEYDIWKDDIEDLVREEQEERRAQRNASKQQKRGMPVEV